MRSTTVGTLAPIAISGSQVRWGRVTSIDRESGIVVTDDLDGLSCICDFLRTSDAAMPAIDCGDVVLFVVQQSAGRGCVLGVVDKYVRSTSTPTRLTLDATENLELRCGESSLTMNREGKVVLKGEQIVSRARGVNKIKGAAVKIN